MYAPIGTSMQSQEISNKKPDERKAFRSPIIILKVSEDGTREHLFGYARNISRSGLFITSINPRKPGEQYSISFKIPDTPICVRCRCEVIWMRKFKRNSTHDPGFGVRFLDLPEDAALALDKWILNQSAPGAGTALAKG